MAVTATGFGPRPMDEVKKELLGRAKENRNPFLYTIYAEVAPVINGLGSVEREEWARAFSALAAPHEERAAQAEAAGDTAAAEEWIEYAPKLSLLDQGILDQPCAPLLCVNGVNDSVFPVADMRLLLEHGSPKSARFYPGGHMGGGNAQAVIVAWLKQLLGQ